MTPPPPQQAVLDTGPFDKNGRLILIGDVLKVYHFQGARWRKHYYMYKQVIGECTLGKVGNRYLQISHLHMRPFDDSDGGYHIACDGTLHLEIEIVQGLDDLDSRPRRAASLVLDEGENDFA